MSDLWTSDDLDEAAEQDHRRFVAARAATAESFQFVASAVDEGDLEARLALQSDRILTECSRLALGAEAAVLASRVMEAIEGDWRQIASARTAGAAYTRQHYNGIARILHHFQSTNGRVQGLAEHFADSMEGTNPQFDRGRFVSAVQSGNTGDFKPTPSGSATLTSRHFRHLADTISRVEPSVRQKLAEHFADNLAITNPQFNRTRFIEAATGVRPDAKTSAAYQPYEPEEWGGARKTYRPYDSEAIPNSWDTNFDHQPRELEGRAPQPTETRDFSLDPREVQYGPQGVGMYHKLNAYAPGDARPQEDWLGDDPQSRLTPILPGPLPEEDVRQQPWLADAGQPMTSEGRMVTPDEQEHDHLHDTTRDWGHTHDWEGDPHATRLALKIVAARADDELDLPAGRYEIDVFGSLHFVADGGDENELDEEEDEQEKTARRHGTVMHCAHEACIPSSDRSLTHEARFSAPLGKTCRYCGNEMGGEPARMVAEASRYPDTEEDREDHTAAHYADWEWNGVPREMHYSQGWSDHPGAQTPLMGEARKRTGWQMNTPRSAQHTYGGIRGHVQHMEADALGTPEGYDAYAYHNGRRITDPFKPRYASPGSAMNAVERYVRRNYPSKGNSGPSTESYVIDNGMGGGNWYGRDLTPPTPKRRSFLRRRKAAAFDGASTGLSGDSGVTNGNSGVPSGVPTTVEAPKAPQSPPPGMGATGMPMMPNVGNSAVQGFQASLVTRASKAQEIAREVRRANPGLSEAQALDLGWRTVASFPSMVREGIGGADYLAYDDVDEEDLTQCPQCGKQTYNEETGICHNCGFRHTRPVTRPGWSPLAGPHPQPARAPITGNPGVNR